MTTATVAFRLRRPTPLALGLGGSLAVIIGSLALAVLSGGGAHVRAVIASGARSAIDPRLILHARTSGVRGVVEGGVRVSGTLYPTLPGSNTLRLTLHHTVGTTPPTGQVRVVVTMPGMDMPPVVATLAARGGGYQSTIALPMFGRYAGHRHSR